MMLILNIPIEPLEERYSNQWRTWFREGLAGPDFMALSIDPAMVTTGKINVGSFLDVVDTNLYKLSQTTEIINLMRNAEKDQQIVLFFQDLWHPGLANIAYVRDGLGMKNVKICGCLHAGSYDEHDFLNKQGMTPWAMHLENGWFRIADKIFVATSYHFHLLCSRRRVDPKKVVVTGFPMYPDFTEFFTENEKENIVVFPHRLNEEKQPQLFDALARELREEMPDWIFVKTKEETFSKGEYYELLNRSKIAVSFALQETWGIAMQEAVLCGCIPICPNRLSYTEMYNDLFLYDKLSDVKELIRRFANNKTEKLLWCQQDLFLVKGKKAIPNMIEEIKKLCDE
jgi:glycosyltransferase involved in cell wall biosynthesis